MKNIKRIAASIIVIVLILTTINLDSIHVFAAEYDDDPMRYTHSMSTDANVYDDNLVTFNKGACSNSYGSVTAKLWGIDVSKYQGDIDWSAAKAAGVQFAFIRVGYRGSEGGTLQEDPKFRQNIAGASAVGIRVGVYIFSQAINEWEAREEAEFLMDRISPYNINMPIVMDYEYVGSASGRLYNAGLSKAQATANCRAFCERVKQNGRYEPMIYANKYFLNNSIDGASLGNSYKIWLAQYNSEPTYQSGFDFWQYSSKGGVWGINGNCDLDWWYVKDDIYDFGYTGMTQVNGEFRYVLKGDIQWTYTGVAYNEYGAWYFRNGDLIWDYTGLGCNIDQNWIYFENGRPNYSYTGMAQNEYGWWFVRNGFVDFTYTGMACNEYGWWYFNKGYIDYTYTGLAANDYGIWVYNNGNLDFNYNGMFCSNNTWYYIINGQVSNYTGMAQNEYGWWYFKNGNLDWDYTGTASNQYGTWFYKGGTINWGYTGMIYVNNQWKYVARGRIDNYTGMACNEYGWWYFRNGDLDWNYTGMAENEYGWWYYQNGKLDWSYTGLGHNEYGDWYYRDGRIAWDYTGMLYADGSWKYVTNGKISDYTGMACNEYGWWYYRNGDLDWTYTGMACNEYGWWYYRNGNLDWMYTGIGHNEYGDWYYRDGQIAWDYTGQVTLDNVSYNIISGYVHTEV